MRQGLPLTGTQSADYASGMVSRKTNGRLARSAGPARHGPAAITASMSVLLLAAGFSIYASTLGSANVGTAYGMRASFLSSNGLQPGADVMLAGVPVGTVTSIMLDDRTMLSQVSFQIESQLRLPADSRLSIGSSTLTSSNALIITPGRSPQLLEPGATVTDTCALTNLEQQVSQYIFGSGGAPSPCDS